MENSMNKPETKQIVSVLVVVAVIVVGYFLLRNTKPPVEEPVTVQGVEVNNGTNTENNPVSASGIRPVTSEDHIVGDVNAKVVIVEYSDTECPFCKQFHNTMQNILRQNRGDVAWVYRHSPIAQLHPKAFHEAEATECAWELGGNSGFWKYTNEIYKRTPSNNGLPVEELPKIAEYTGLNLKAFTTCLDSGKFADKINTDMTDGRINKVEGTPTSFVLVDGKVVNKIDGAQDFSGVQAIVDQYIK